MGKKRRYSPKMLLPESVVAILGALVNIGGVATEFDVEDVSGFSNSYLTFCKAKLLELGWMHKPYQNAYMITERGRIVLAIETGRRTRGRGKGWLVQSFVEFSGYSPLRYQSRQERQQRIAAVQSLNPSLET